VLIVSEACNQQQPAASNSTAGPRGRGPEEESDARRAQDPVRSLDWSAERETVARVQKVPGVLNVDIEVMVARDLARK
jgi:hypothetical protein